MCGETNTWPARSRSGCRFEIGGAPPSTEIGRSSIGREGGTSSSAYVGGRKRTERDEEGLRYHDKQLCR
jgi:hypothetical protein